VLIPVPGTEYTAIMVAGDICLIECISLELLFGAVCAADITVRCWQRSHCPMPVGVVFVDCYRRCICACGSYLDLGRLVADGTFAAHPTQARPKQRASSPCANLLTRLLAAKDLVVRIANLRRQTHWQPNALLVLCGMTGIAQWSQIPRRSASYLVCWIARPFCRE
jgi:hypothetical protein